MPCYNPTKTIGVMIMRGKSHAAMGQRLVREYMKDIPRRYIRVFLIGCIQPDRNPTTYLKGSVRAHWMRGHDYRNARRFLFRLANRLEQKKHFAMWEYYSLGKLVHYTMDAFTYPHNDHFSGTLYVHRQHEIRLQIFFLRYLRKASAPQLSPACSCADLIRKAHAEYMHQPGCIETDAAYAFTTCCQLVRKLTEKAPGGQDYQFHSREEDDIMAAQ